MNSKYKLLKISLKNKRVTEIVRQKRALVRDALKRPKVHVDQRCEMFKEHAYAQVFRALKALETFRTSQSKMHKR
jgi:hypothetical protein